MDPFFTAIETTALSTWLRESPSLWAFPFVLILHTVGLAFLVGANVALDARVLGLAAGVRPTSLRRYDVIMWAGFWVNAVSGVLLLIAYPTKALTNPLFYGKLGLIAVGLVLAQALRRQLHDDRPLSLRARRMAIVSLVVWGAGITAGRLLAYTYSRLTVDLVGMTLDSVLQAIEPVLRTTALGAWVRHSQWAWPVLESLHFIGMSVLIGTIGLFDLRLMGFARGVPYAALHRLIPLGIAGYTLNLLTGLCFLSGTPDQYLFNLAFRVKVSCMFFAGLNVVFFYTRVFKRLEALAPESPPPLGARVAGAVSLTMWIGVMSAGRLLTFFRPPYV